MVEPGRRTLLVAATGGHLSELLELHDRVPALQQDPLWFVPESDQSVSLLEGRPTAVAPEVLPRDALAVPAASLAVDRLLRRHGIDCVVSTGAGVAVAAFAAARARGIACHYIESAARVEAPSLTGRLVQRIPGVHLWSQHAWDEPGRWRLAPSVFDGYRPVPRRGASSQRLRVLVTLGTMRFGFRRLVERVLACLPPGCETTWQTGGTDVSGLGVHAQPWLSPSDLARAARGADVVIAHAGVGSALTALGAGAWPVLVPRRRRYDEHVDDHQVQVAQALAERGLASAVEADELGVEHLLQASRQTAERVAGAHDDLRLARSRRW